MLETEKKDQHGLVEWMGTECLHDVQALSHLQSLCLITQTGGNFS